MALIIRRLLAVFGILLLAAVFFGSYQLWQNNRKVGYPQRPELEKSLKKGISWLEHNRTEILNETNPMLWWMVKESADLTHDSSLIDLYGQYKERYLDANPSNAWLHLFYAHSTVPLHLGQLENLPNYNLFFLYGLSCNADLERSSIIQAQLRPDFCDDHILSPACVTHQMMGFRFMQKRDCGNSEYVHKAITVLQDKVVTQLTWDVRVVDVYLQRVLMLQESGTSERIQPAWIARILLAQDVDGGWSGFQPIISFGSELSAGFSARAMSIDRKISDFHATAQGVLLMSLILSNSK